MRSRSPIVAFMVASSSLVLAQPRFSVTYPSSAYSGSFSGRVVIYFAKASARMAPRFGPDWSNPQPMYSAVFKGMRPGRPMLISSANAIGFPGKLSKLADGDYKVQAVVDRNLGGRQIGQSPGNLYSGVRTIHLSGGSNQVVRLGCTNVVAEPTFVETKHLKFIKVRSRLLSAFYHRPTFVKGAVMLPDAWIESPKRKFPIFYEVPGFGGDPLQLSGRDGASKGTLVEGVPFIKVYLDPNVPLGHSVFADSANNGPWGKALTTEFIPAVEKKFRAIGTMRTRFVGGHSSGGWSSLWLQVEYPDVFGGVWSTSPDPVDFHEFQLVDIYSSGANIFRDRSGKLVPLARMNGVVWIYAKNFSDMERPIRGEQLGSFDAVFSPRGWDGNPERLYNPDMGKVNPAVANAWKKYDIALKLRREWKTLGPKLKGKLHIFCGDVDTFYLDGAVRALKKEMKVLGSDAEVAIVPGDHFSMMSPDLTKKMNTEMVAAFKRAGR